MEKQEFITLLQNYLDGKATPLEVQMLTNFCQSFQQEDSLTAVELQQSEDKVYARLQPMIGQRKSLLAHRIHFLKTTWFRYAAAIIIMVTGTAIWYANYNHSKSFNPLNPSSRQVADIKPGSDKAILTLANGQQIILDSIQGDIVKQGSLTVVNLAGKLKYEGVGIAAEYNTISTPKGGQYQIVLPDGSKVWLNAASSIKFPTAFSGMERNVDVIGEAYLEIAQNHRQPFVVKTNGIKIQVLGTSFNVNAYQDENMVKTTLINGSVKVSSNQQLNAGAIILKPGQQAEIAEGSNKKINVQTANIEQVLAWKNGIFDFSGTELRTVMKQLERWYDIDVQYEGDVPLFKTQGQVDRGVKLSGMIRFLSNFGVNARLNGKTLIVGKK